jgi:hypothetical protein
MMIIMMLMMTINDFTMVMMMITIIKDLMIYIII